VIFYESPVARCVAGHRYRWLFTISLLALGLDCYSAASAATLCVKANKQSGCEATIGAAVAAAAPGDVIQVAEGIYNEQVTINKPLSLVATSGSRTIIDATNFTTGIFVNGMSTAPNPGVSDVLISGFTIQNASFEGILVVNASDVTIVGNHVTDNNRSLDINSGTCPGIPVFETNEGVDCGEGIHLMAVDNSTVIHNEIDHNAGGVLLSDETGPSQHNYITENSVHDNPFDCGITMASHAPATSVIPTATVSFGVINNVVEQNISRHNGTQVPGAGAGVGIFAPAPGAMATGNVVIGNDLLDNGMPGVAMHNHAFAPAPAPPVNLNDNAIIGNHFSGNAADASDTATSGTTGINIASLAPVTGTVISRNTFESETIDVAFKVPSGQLDAHFNSFSNGIGIDNLGSGTVDASNNWWNCPLGPGRSRCATAVGSGVSFTPFLDVPFNVEPNIPSYDSHER
jgi:nitrous oxidase accessory protein NosD